eukprot:TRINITY_DN2493_c0_g1_i2.p1 TRINITY_DN2493_c0_g1~~TRINITY_DN2493_c0_g1_i2.p1  ORF type:complete len:254 (+),score=22.70 TRINITY_DN2493_c0_g1_i2:224-985(+)
MSGRWSLSGFIDVFSTHDSLVVQWTAVSGWTSQTLNVYVDTTQPSALPRATKFPYFQTSIIGLKFMELVLPLSDFPGTTCDTSFFISVQLDTTADSSAACGANHNSEPHSCHGRHSSWMLGMPIESPSEVWGSFYSRATFCCCFNSQHLLDDTIFRKISFSKQRKNDKTDPADFIQAILARLLAFPGTNIHVLEVSQEDDTYVSVVRFTRGPRNSARTAVAILESIDTIHFEHLGAKDVTIMVVPRDTYDTLH